MAAGGFILNGRDFHDDSRSGISAEFRSARGASHQSFLMGNCQTVFACLYPMHSVNSILLVRSLAVDLVAFGENVLLVKTSRGIIWAESLLLGTSVLGSYTEK